MIDLTDILNMRIDATTKGVPGGAVPFRLADVGAKRWSLLREDIPLPSALLKQSALQANSARMRQYLERVGAVLCPHAKTYMSPQLSKLQTDAGAWGLTVASVNQAQVFRRFGFERILLANELVGRQNVRWIIDELDRSAGFDFYCLADSIENVEMLAAATQARRSKRSLQILLEVGYAGARTGVRTKAAALSLARAIKAREPYLSLAGIECYEGVLPGEGRNAEERVRALLHDLEEVAHECDAEALFGCDPVILSAGGSAYYDLAGEGLRRIALSRSTLVVIRSGCYLVHDAGLIASAYARMAERTPWVRDLPVPQESLEVWAYIQSRPETQRAFATIGRRDVSSDSGYPVPRFWFRSGFHKTVQTLPPEHSVVALNDQHCYLETPESSPLAVGDMVGFGISHPCTTFDKWRLIYIVDDDYEIVDGIWTFF